MTYPSLAIIGTAGRKADSNLLTRFHYERMVGGCIKLIDHLKLDRSSLRLYSGGAAWSDHLVVTLALRGVVAPQNVTLFLPSQLTEKGYVGKDDFSTKTASTANFYHRKFSEKTGTDPIGELNTLAQLGGVLIPGNGSFHARNSDVAKAVSPDGAIIACTTGSERQIQPFWTIRRFKPTTSAAEAGLNDGGTADTFNKAQCEKFHMLLGEMDNDPSLI